MKKDTRYHIHITSKDIKAPKGFKLTTVKLENKKVIKEHNMFTRTFVGTGDINRDVEFMKNYFSKQFNEISRFKIELLNKSNFIKEYSDVNYREIHIKLQISNNEFKNIKDILDENHELYGFRLSNNPKEIKKEFTTQFVNMRYFEGNYDSTNKKIDNVLRFLNNINVNILEIKDELSVYDSNFDEDKWWTE